jgi:AraC-like DNA-binding protein
MCSAALLKPFFRLLSTRQDIPDSMLAALSGSDSPDGRVAVATVQRMVETLASLSADPGIGLRAALFTQLGDFEILEWVAMSASTWREANQTACRYIRVLNEAADYQQAVCGDKSHLMLGSTIPLSRVLVDFQLAAYHLALRLRVPEVPPELEVWMKHAAPSDVSDYRAIFPDAKLVFDAPFNGFVSDAWRLDTPLPTANQSLNKLLRAHADHLLAQLGAGDSLSERVSADILNSMREGNLASATRTAERLGLTRRTMTRQLRELGTSHTELVRVARYRTAAHYLCNTSHSIEDIAFLIGFSECSPFVRAFRLWSGHTPLEYRRLQG